MASLLDHHHGNVPCLITRKQRDMDGVAPCPVIPKTVDHETLDKLEWVWGFDYFTMNVDTHCNLIHVGAEIIGAFRKGWLLLPVDVEILEELRNATCNPPPKSMIHQVYKDKSTFRYKFIPLPPMDGTRVVRYEGDYTTSPGPADITVHFYPFDQLPIVESHVYPHYVTYDIGTKLKYFFGEDLDQNPVPELSFSQWVEGLNTSYARHTLEMCHKLYRSWMEVTPPPWYIQGKNGEDDAPDGNRTAEDTARSDTGRKTSRAKSESQANGKDVDSGCDKGRTSLN